MDAPPSVLASLPGWARAIFRVAVIVIWLPFVAAPVVGFLYRGWWGALLPLAIYAFVGVMLLLGRSPRARRWAEAPADIDTSDPRWRNLMR